MKEDTLNRIKDSAAALSTVVAVDKRIARENAKKDKFESLDKDSPTYIARMDIIDTRLVELNARKEALSQ